MSIFSPVGNLLPLLLDCTLKATLLGAGAMLALSLPTARRASAAARHLVLTLTLMGMLLLPVLSLVLPGWQVLPRWVPLAVARPEPVGTGQLGVAAEPAVTRLPAPTVEAPGLLPAVPMGGTEVGPLPRKASVAGAPVVREAWSWRTAFGVLYVAGGVLTLLPVGLSALALLRLRVATPAAGAELLCLLQELRQAMGVQTCVRLLQSRGHVMPMTWGGWGGWLWPACILLPANAGAWPGSRLRCVLLHELAHIARRDVLTLFLARVACAVYWFHPLAWVLAVRLRAEAEQACDDRVLAVAGREGAGRIKPSTYAAELFALAGAPAALRLVRLPALAAIAMARPHQPSQLHTRLKAILDTTRTRRSLGRSSALVLGALIASTVVVLAVARAQSNDPALGGAGAWASERGFLAQKIEETTLTAGWGRPGWRNLPFTLTADEEKAVRGCVALAYKAHSYVNGTSEFSTPATRTALEAVLAKQPDFFYAEFLLSQWHRGTGDAKEADRLLAAAYAHAPVILVQPYVLADGRPLADTPIQSMAIECNRVQNGAIDQSLDLAFNDLRTDAHGNLFLPVYNTVYRRQSISYPAGYDLTTGKLGFFETSRKVAVMPAAVCTPKVGEFMPAVAPDAPPVASVTLPGDVRLEVVAVGREPGAADAFWTAAGSPAPAMGISQKPGVHHWPDDIGRRIVLKFSKALPADAVLRFQFSEPVSATNYYTTVRPQDLAKPYALFAAFPTKPARTSIRVGVAAGPWLVRGTYDPATNTTAGELPDGYAVRNTTRGETAPRLEVQFPTPTDLQTRLIALDAAGKELRGDAAGTSSDGTTQTLFYRLPGTTIDRIKTVRLETRTFQSADFLNIALHPGVAAPASVATTRPEATRPTPRFQIRLVTTDPTIPADEFADPAVPGRTLRIARNVLLTDDALASASAGIENDTPVIHFRLTPAATGPFGAITSANRGKGLAMILDGKLLAAPTIQSAITGGSGTISLGSRTPQADAEKLAATLNSLARAAASTTAPATTAPAKAATFEPAASPLSDADLLLIGEWNITHNGPEIVTFRPDRRFDRTALGNTLQRGTWQFADGELRLQVNEASDGTAPGTVQVLRVGRLDADALTGTNLVTNAPVAWSRRTDHRYPPSDLDTIRHWTGLVNHMHDPDLAKAMVYDSEMTGGVHLQNGQALAERHYLAALGRITDPAIRARIYVQLGVLFGTNYHPELGEKADYARCAEYMRKALAEEPTRISSDMLRARLMQISSLPSREEKIRFRRENLQYLRSLTRDRVRRDWLPAVPGQTPSDDQLDTFLNLLEHIIEAETENLDSAEKATVPR
jgi:beta-lactamase regulating signal transducer with metallopeptidase domain